jgi:pimeloyl-ACP methyl ester carboxylesterase
MMTLQTFSQQAAGIDWYCEARGRGTHIVLIPSGEGDCGSFAHVADDLAEDFSVLTFDMPGFSRSGPPPIGARSARTPLRGRSRR